MAPRSAAGDEIVSATTLADLVAMHAARRPDEPALVEADTNRCWTWRDLDNEVRAVARGLLARGITPGAAIAIDAPNSGAWIRTWLGAMRAGVVVVPLNPGLAPTEAAALAEGCDVRLVVDAGEGDKGEADAGVHVAGVDRVALDDLLHRSDTALPPPPDPEAIAVLIGTTGTSGASKAVRLSHRALLAHCRHTVEAGVPGPDAIALLMLPLYHIYGLNAVAGTALYAGATLVVVAGMPDDLPGVVATHRVTDVPVTPSVLYRLIQDDDGRLGEQLATVRSLTSGGAPLAQALAEEVHRRTGLRVQQGYGMTEAAPGITTSEGCPDAERPPGFVGRALPGVDLRIGDGSEDTRPAELFIRGDNLFSGYHPGPHEVGDEDGWFATGDIGYRLGDDVHLVDRARELIIVSGFNVYPSEVEDVLSAFPGVSHAAVIAQPDEQTGERVVAFVSGRGIRRRTRELRAHCAERLARYKLPVEIYALNRMPMTSAGEVRKAALRDLLDTIEPESE